MADQVDRSVLLLRRPVFGGAANRTLAGSQPDWDILSSPKPPEGRRTCCWCWSMMRGSASRARSAARSSTPRMSRVAEEGLRYNRFHVTALCSPTRAALLTGRNHHAVGFGSIGELSSGFPGIRRSFRRTVRRSPGAAGERLQHGGVRQVAPDAGPPAGRGGPVRPLAQRAGVRLLLGVPGRRGGPVGPGHHREQHDDRGAAGGRLLLARRHGRQDDRVAARRARPGSGQAVVRVLLHRLRARAAPRAGGVGARYKGRFDEGWDAYASRRSSGRSGSASSRPTRS